MVLGLSDREFYAVTPRQFHLLIGQHKERVWHQELLMGILAAEIANRSMHPPEKWLPPAHFMPSQMGKESKPVRTRINRKRVADKIRNFFDAQMKAQHG